MTQTPIIVFVCEHGAAKSVIAAAYFNKLAKEKGVDLQAIARGTDPDKELSLKTVNGLTEDGLQIIETVPQKLLVEEIKSAQKVITFCELPDEYQQTVEVERWDGIPPVSENYAVARDAIVEQINRLMAELN